MPHTTSSEVISPSLGTLPTVDVWNNLRSLTTFSTFHQANGKSNGSFAETSFFLSQPSQANDSQPDSTIRQNGSGHLNGTSENTLSGSRYNLKTRSPNFGKLARPVVTPPPRLESIVSRSETNTISDTNATNGLSTIGQNGLKDEDVTDVQDEYDKTSSPSPLNGVVENGVIPEDDEKDVRIQLGAFDKRFGFSVVGGCDEGFSPRIDNITPGSPADRADLEVGDEILEVNGRSLDNCTHTEVISHIHQCIRSRTICLRVKRKTSCKLALDLSRNSNVQDAFVIAVEQQARERLEKLSALKKIKPVDMTKLSQELNDAGPELNGCIEASPIYVTTVPEIHGAMLRKEPPHHLRPLNGQVGMIDHDQELELKQEIFETCDDTLSSPETPPRERLLVEPPNGGTNNRFSQLCVSVETLLPNLLDKQSRVSPGERHPLKHFGDSTKPNCPVQGRSNYKPNVRSSHEMPVDVSDAFADNTKVSSRYPPQRAGETAKLSYNCVTDTSARDVDSKSYSFSKPTGNSRQNFCSGHPRIEPALQDDVFLENPTEEQLERIRKYQDEIHKRKEAEERRAKENEFLRNSLRGSKKLQALEANPPLPPKVGMENTAFELGEDKSLSSSFRTSEHYVSESKATTPELSKPFGPSDLLQSLYRLSASLQGNGHKDSDLMLVESLIRNADFQNILEIHNKVQEVCCFNCPPTPVSAGAQDLTQEVISVLQECPSVDAAELLDLLSRFEVEGLLYAHDKVGERQATPKATPDEELLDRAARYTEDSVKIVRIDKTNEPLGATVRNEGEAVVIGRIVKGGAAEKSGLLHEGDEILEVNGVEMRGKSVNDVCDILATMNGTLTFLVIPTQQEMKKLSQEVVMHVKAHFDYDPDDDLYIPCRELGISFQKGDVLHVISQEDPNWWQAYREGEEDQALAGLVPSKNFQQQRESMKQTIIGEANNKEKTKKAKLLCVKKYHKKKKKKMYNATLEESDGDQILTYDEVALYYPRANRKRPTVLIGPPNIGRHELRQRLMEDTERFAAAVPHTSRTKRDTEVDGADYHFISRQQFEADISSGRFVEHGEYEKNYYGTSLDAIRAVVSSGKICVLNLHPQSLKILKNSDLKPYVVFVAPPSLEKLRQNRLKAGDNPKDDELKEIIEKAREMEESYGHFFDMVIVNSDVDKAFGELLREINTLEREPQWVPRNWLQNQD